MHKFLLKLCTSSWKLPKLDITESIMYHCIAPTLHYHLLSLKKRGMVRTTMKGLFYEGIDLNISPHFLSCMA